MKRPLIVLTGPTAVGKSALAVALAKKIGGEVISADSMQVYRGMDIGSAKITAEEMEGIPHYMIDVLEPDEPFNIVRFQQMGQEALERIYANGHIPIIAGGTGFYIQSLLYDIDFTENEDGTEIRRVLEAQAARGEAHLLYKKLQEVDPPSAEQIHPNNIKRVIRALEYYEQTGRRISEHNEQERAKESPYNFLYLVLSDDRQKIYERIDRRVDLMMKAGLLEEVRRLADHGYDRSLISMQGLGYKEILAYLEGECTLEEAVYVIKRDTRHFAKRQLTWFRRERDVIWLDRREYPDDETMLARIQNLIKEKGL